MERRSYWTHPGGRGEIRVETLGEPGEGEARVETIVSGVSRGTESLVHLGRVPERVRDLMRSPFQRGDLPGEVFYGYLSVGEVAAVGPDTPDDLVGRRVFCLYPHADRYVAPISWLHPVPDDVPSERAVLAGAVETAVNALWDGGPRLGDRIAVVGGGMIGLSVAALLRRFPLDRLELLDPDPAVAERAQRFGLTWKDPADGLGDCDLVFHASSTAAGLARSLELLGDEGEVVEMSWYGTTEPQVPLGGDFHARRLRIRASQVGMIAESRRARRTTADRMATALAALADNAFDCLLTGPVDLDDLPATMDDIAHGRTPAICHVVRHR
ncbi:zinc-dependent alcohol dehydrogenase [Mobilicoccus pelagius]|uniref:Putative oxidoreductase n=1 Tax=Mobilicoccus pelagius NBRC 104925 TaxID=1089455 RepID=H5UNZ2_9MICO|nr:zinc-binding alcohol dehydrogenase [Mobilicoccus pelagius]GAB47450.1 putative oxidoreductase [Mobilicoccus pelagius NBRC 104925]